MTTTPTLDNRWDIRELDYLSRNYQPFGGPPEDMCTRCRAFYKTLHELGLTREPFMPICTGKANKDIHLLNPDEFEDNEEYLEAVATMDPVVWALKNLNWEARWYQAEVINCTAQFKVLRSGRRIGKSEALMVLCLNRAMTNSNFPCLLVAPYERQVTLLFDKVDRLIANSDSIRRSIKRQTRNPHRIEFWNGSVIEAFTAGTKSGARSDKIRGQDAKFIGLDEVDLMDPKELEAILAILASHPNCELFACSTPTGERKMFFEWCFPTDTPILVPAGYKKIQTLREGDEVLGCSGFIEHIEKIYERKYSGNLIRLSFEKTYKTLESTPEHPHLAIKRGEAPQFTPAKDIKPGDWVCLTPINRMPTALPELKTIRQNYRICNSWIDGLLREGYLGTIDRRARRAYLEARELLRRIASSGKLERDFFSWLGFCLAEGNIIKSSVSFCGVKTSHRRGEPIIDEILALNQRLFPDKKTSVLLKEKPNGKWTEVCLYSPGAALLFNLCIGQYSHLKKLHPALLGACSITNLCEAYVKGDGFNTTSGGVGVSTTSEILADQIWRLYLASGSPTSLAKRDAKPGHKAFYTVYVGVRDTDSIIFYEGVPFVRVRSVEKFPYDGQVYNLETSLTHTYSANGFGTHNCTRKDLKFKETHLISHESPSYTEDVDLFFRSSFSRTAYEQEIYAEWGSAEGGVFRRADIEAALSDYRLEDCAPNPGCLYGVGVDWNKIYGTHITVVEWGNGKYKLVYKEIVPAGEFGQLAAIDRVTAAFQHWGARFIYADAGYGEVQLEIIKKLGMAAPGSGLASKTHGIAMNASIEIRDPATNILVKKPAKNFMLNMTSLQLEHGRVVLPSSEDTNYATNEDSGRVPGLVQQMRNFRIEKFSSTGHPVYSQGQDHTLTAFALCILGFILEYSNVKGGTVDARLLPVNPHKPLVDGPGGGHVTRSPESAIITRDLDSHAYFRNTRTDLTTLRRQQQQRRNPVEPPPGQKRPSMLKFLRNRARDLGNIHRKTF